MSSCQDSMDTVDSIPRPEYEDIVPVDEDEEEEDDEEFWIKKVNTLENGTAQRQAETSSSQPTVSVDSSSVSTAVTTDSSNSNKTIDETMDDDYEDDEISYDEADENFDEYDADVDSGKTSGKSISQHATQTIEHNDDPLKIPTKPAVVDGVPSTIGMNTILPDAQVKTNNSNLVVVTLLNENVKLVAPEPSMTVTGTTVDEQKPIVTPEGEKISPMDDTKSSQIAVPKEDQPRSSTPSGRGNREFLALQKSFTESKVLSKFVNETERSRKSRKLPLKSDDSNFTDEPEKEKFRICRARSKSCTRSIVRPVTLLNTSAPQRWPSDDKLHGRRENMRSQNTDFVQKQMKFLNRVNHEQTGDDPMSDASDEDQSLNDSNKTVSAAENKSDCWQPPPKRGADSFCWKCRKCADLIACSKCPRSYHYKCIKIGSTTRLDKTWTCPECVNLDNCINGSKKSKKEALPVDLLNQLLQFALKRMKQIKGHEKLLDVPDDSECPLYKRFVVNPVTLNSIKEKIEKKSFRCTEEFVLETKWIQHNVSIAYAAYSSKDGLVAKTLLKVCRQEAAEIETCSECYLNANTHRDWFLGVCLRPHILLWAKLKGFPYWPAKGMGLGPNSLVNVRFFGDHDRAFVPVKDCFLYSEIDPNPHSGKRTFRPGIADCIKEVDVHIERIKGKVGAFNFAPVRTPYDPSNEMTQLEEMMPGVTEYIKRQQALQKPPLTYKIVKTAGNNLSFIKKPDSGTDSDHSSVGIDKNLKNTRTSTEISKPSPLSEGKKVKESEIVAQVTSPKSTTVTKSIPNKTVTSNYEVVAKPDNKEESNSSKINSVILKRKSDVVAVAPTVKKSKSSEDSALKEYPHSSTSLSPKSEAKPEEPKDTTAVTAAKRPRSSRSAEKMSITKSSSTAASVMLRSSPNEPAKVQLPLTQQQIPQQLQMATPPPPKKHHSHPKPQQMPQQPQKTDAAIVPSVNKDTFEPSSAMAKLVQNRQGVTIKKISKKQSAISTFFGTENNGPRKRSADEKMTSALIRYSQPVLHAQKSKAIPLPPPPPKPIVSLPKSTPKVACFSTSSRPNSSYPSTRVQISSKQTSPLNTEKPKTTQGLIPFEDIKLEKPEDEEPISTKPTTSTSKSVDPLPTINTSSASSTSLSSASKASGNPKTSHSGDNSPSLPVNPDQVKKEIIFDDESSSNSTPSQESSSSAASVNPPNNRCQTEPRRIVGETMIQRIVVRSLESLSMLPPPLQMAPAYLQTSQARAVPSATTSVTSLAQPNKSNPRARKSFPNKGPNSTTVLLPPDVKRSLTKNSMVYIPVDSQNNAVPIQPLTAVSKQINNQNMVKVTCATTIPTSDSVQNSINLVNTSSPILTSFTTIPMLTSTPPPESITVSAALTNATNTVSSTVTVVTSSVAKPSSNNFILSPLQLSETVTPIPISSEEEDVTETDAHILSGIVTANLAAAITDSIVGGPPKLTRRPNNAPRSNGNYGYNSETAGPVHKLLIENAHKMKDFFADVIHDTVNDMANSGVLEAKIVQLELEIEAKDASYTKHLYELQQNTDKILCQMKKSMEIEKLRLIAETRGKCEVEKIHAVEAAKKKQWCTNCGREANLYCCWNTTYCDTNCQVSDWMRHKSFCVQVNVHLNTDLQGPGNLIHVPRTFLTVGTQTNQAVDCSNIVTPTNQTINCTTPNQPQQVYRASQKTETPPPPLQPLPTTSTVSSSLVSQTKGVSQSNASAPIGPYTSVPIAAYTSAPIGVFTSAPIAVSASTPKEVLKLPPTTYLRPLPPTIRINPPPVHRFNIPLPLAAATSTGGPPYTLVHREGSWELMGTAFPHPPPSPAVSSGASFPQPIQSSRIWNLIPDRTLGPVMMRPNQM